MTPGDEARFWSYVQRGAADECWLWIGTTAGKGYGQFAYSNGSGRVREGAHRIAYTLALGPIPDGMTIDHLCRTHNCVNPAHLEAVTNRENILRGISPLAQKARQTHCVHGHSLSGDNLYQNGNHRYCRICNRAYARA